MNDGTSDNGIIHLGVYLFFAMGVCWLVPLMDVWKYVISMIIAAALLTFAIYYTQG